MKLNHVCLRVMISVCVRACAWPLVNNWSCVFTLHGVSKCLSINILQRWLDPNKPVRKQLKSMWNPPHTPAQLIHFILQPNTFTQVKLHYTIFIINFLPSWLRLQRAAWSQQWLKIHSPPEADVSRPRCHLKFCLCFEPLLNLISTPLLFLVTSNIICDVWNN